MKWLYWVVGILVAIVIWYNFAHPTYTFRYRATLTVDTPQGPNSGSSVIEVTWKKKNALSRAFSGGIPWTTKIRGVAPIIDLGAYGTIVAALQKRDGGETGKPTPGKESVGGAGGWPFSAFSNDKRAITRRELMSVRGPSKMKPNRWPQLVWIPTGTSDPDKAVPLLPREFAEHIGPIHFNSMTLEPTNDPVVERIELAPGWLEAIRNRYRPGAPFLTQKTGVFFFDLGQVETRFPPNFDS